MKRSSVKIIYYYYTIDKSSDNVNESIIYKQKLLI